MTCRRTIRQAVLSVMTEAGEALFPREVYRRIVEHRLYKFHAQRPEGVVRAEIRRHCKDIDFPTAAPTKYFGMTADGKFYPLPAAQRRGRRRGPRAKGRPRERVSVAATLRQLQELHKLHRDAIKERILHELKRLSPGGFERFARRLLGAYGFENVRVTGTAPDGGIDGDGQLKVGLAHMRVAFQCKRWTRASVGRPEIDKFRGAIQGEYEQGILFTTAQFSAGAKQVSIRRGAVPVILIDGSRIVDLMIEKGFGVEYESLPVYTYALDTIIAEDEEAGQGALT